jgi:hypothetical protein
MARLFLSASILAYYRIGDRGFESLDSLPFVGKPDITAARLPPSPFFVPENFLDEESVIVKSNVAAT